MTTPSDRNRGAAIIRGYEDFFVAAADVHTHNGQRDSAGIAERQTARAPGTREARRFAHAARLRNTKLRPQRLGAACGSAQEFSGITGELSAAARGGNRPSIGLSEIGSVRRVHDVVRAATWRTGNLEPWKSARLHVMASPLRRPCAALATRGKCAHIA